MQLVIWEWAHSVKIFACLLNAYQNASTMEEEQKYQVDKVTLQVDDSQALSPFPTLGGC